MFNKNKSTVFYQNVKLPLQLVEAIQELGLTKGKAGNEMKAFHFISILLSKAYGSVGQLSNWRNISRDYFYEVFGTRYFQFINPLRDSSIVDFNSCASAEAARSHKYRLPKKWFQRNEEWVTITIRYKMNLEKNLTVENLKSFNNLKDFYKLLKIDKERLYNTMFEKIDEVNNEVYRKNIKTDGDIYTRIQFSDGFEKRYSTKAKLIEEIYRTDKDLIQDGRDFFLMNEEDYRNLKQKHILNTWKPAIDDLVEGNLRAVRDKKGNREHTNLTNLATELREVIFEDNDLVNLDIDNSQFAFFAKNFRELIKKKGKTNTIATERFLLSAEKGKLYELIQEELGLKSRGFAKQEMFLLNFSKAKFSSQNKSLLEKKFPQIMEYIKEYKECYGDNAFSTKLQRTEADIIVDKVRPQLSEMGIISTSIHDSVVVRIKDKERALKIMKEVFKINKLKANLKTEGDDRRTAQAA